jgi:uncharacterized membrane protein YhaH (DUF805 family)
MLIIVRLAILVLMFSALVMLASKWAGAGRSGFLCFMNFTNPTRSEYVYNQVQVRNIQESII